MHPIPRLSIIPLHPIPSISIPLHPIPTSLSPFTPTAPSHWDTEGLSLPPERRLGRN